ncbi:putative dsRNA-binding protein [Cardiobacterium hominis]|uniref:putative dsRNA-binding protein n=1 Tax=Cardiobacterium hominis TaxID=2718 RepID=UPI00288B6DDB|nr:putative dsRNA-binding protein [Cardiobacterium hominis]
MGEGRGEGSKKPHPKPYTPRTSAALPLHRRRPPRNHQQHLDLPEPLRRTRTSPATRLRATIVSGSYRTTAHGSSRKKAEQQAAADLLAQYQNHK